MLIAAAHERARSFAGKALRRALAGRSADPLQAAAAPWLAAAEHTGP